MTIYPEAQAKHPSHVTRSSDASTFDEVCINCGATDQVPGGWGKLAEPLQAERDAAAPKLPDDLAGLARARSLTIPNEFVQRFETPPIHKEAATIQSLAARNAELRAEIAALKKEAADVVRPFVEYTPDRCFEGNERWKPAVCRDPGGGWYGAEDFRAARSFLDKWEGRDG